MLDEKLRKLGIIARRLAADADLAPLRAARRDHLGDHRFHRGIAFIENVRDDLRIAVHAEDQLCQSFEPIEKPSKISANSLARITLLGISHIT